MDKKSNKKAFTLAEVFSPHPNGQRKAAFTLAEVLITLGIIGVVAAITMPTLISNYKKQVTASKLRHVYAVLKNAEVMAIKEEGDINGWDFIGSSHMSGKESIILSKYYYPYIKTSKCDYNASITTEGGTFFGIKKGNYDCLPDGTVITGIETANGYLGTTVLVDLNGSKGPNILGRDVFSFLINRPVFKSSDYNTSSYRVIPKCPVGLSTCFGGPYHGASGYYWEGDEETLIQHCLDGSGSIYTLLNQGNSCAYMIENAGWKIPDNYPIKF